MLTLVRPRPVNPSMAKVEIPRAASARCQNSMFPPRPPEPCIRITVGRRSVPALATRRSPATVTGFAPSDVPVRNCRSVSVRLSNG